VGDAGRAAAGAISQRSRAIVEFKAGALAGLG